MVIPEGTETFLVVSSPTLHLYTAVPLFVSILYILFLRFFTHCLKLFLLALRPLWSNARIFYDMVYFSLCGTKRPHSNDISSPLPRIDHRHLLDGAPRDLIDDHFGIVVGGWEPLDPESELGKEAVNLALEHYQKSVEPDHHVKHIWLAEMQV